MNILRFQTNVPNEVSLESPQGVVVQGRYGDRMMFNLTDGQVMYVPPIVANKIEAEGIGPGIVPAVQKMIKLRMEHASA